MRTRVLGALAALLSVAVIVAAGVVAATAWEGTSITASWVCTTSGATVTVFGHDDKAGDLKHLGSGVLEVTGPETHAVQWSWPATGDEIATFDVEHAGTYTVTLDETVNESVSTKVDVRHVYCKRPSPIPTPRPSPTASPTPAQTPTPTPSGSPSPAPSPTATPTPVPNPQGTPTPGCEETPPGGDCSGIGKG